MDPSYVQNIHTLLEHTINPDTNTIKAATTQLNTQYYKQPECIPALFEITASSPNQAVRQLAAVELKKRVSVNDGKLWKNTPEALRVQIKERLLRQVTDETAAIVRHALARTISAIADLELTVNPPQWPDLLPFLYQAAQSQQASHRETAVYVLFSLLDAVADSFAQNLPVLFKLFSTTLVDQESSEVRTTTLRALGKIAEYIDSSDKDDVRTFQQLIPNMIQVLQQALADGSDEAAKHGFDVFETLLIIDAPLISKHISQLTEFFLTAGGDKELDDELRCMALNALAWTVRYKKNKVQSLNLARPIIERLLPIGCEDDPEDADDDSPSRLAFRTLDALAQALPPQQVFPVLTSQLQVYMAGDARMRKSALMAFGVSIEGCSEFIRPHVDELWPVIDRGLQDPELIVRKAACIALGCMCEWLPEECATRHGVIVPILFNLISDPPTQKNACACLDSYLEILGEEIAQYLTLLMERLLVLLESGPVAVKVTVTGAIGSAAHASKEGFRPYFDQTIKRLVPFLALTNTTEETDLRGIATDTIGTIAEAVGAELFRPYFTALMKAAFEGLTLENPRLRESSFIFFGVMAQVFEDEFAVYLPQVVPALIASCQQSESDEFITDEDGVGTKAAAQAAVEAFTSGNGVETLEEDEGADLDELEKMFSGVNSALAIEKEVAADTIGEIFSATKSAFLPYVEECISVLIEQLDHYYEGIRKSAVNALFTFIKTFYELAGSPDWVPGHRVVVPLHADLRKLVDAILPPIFDAWRTEDDKSVVSLMCSELAETMQKCGPALIDGRLDEVATFAVEILEKKSLCQQDPDFDDENVDEDADSSEYEAVLISNAADIFGALATVLGPDFAQAFGSILPLISNYAGAKKSNSERSMAIGSLGEIIVGMKGGVTQFTPDLLQLISGGLQDPEADVRSNAAFASGVLVQHTEADLSAQFLPLLSALQPLFHVPEHSPPACSNAKDNAAGAVARMICKNQAAVPLDQVLPVLFSTLPLRHDTLENQPVFTAIFSLFRSQSQLILNYIDQLLPVFKYVLEPSRSDEIPEETAGELRALIEHLKTVVPEKVAAAGLA